MNEEKKLLPIGSVVLLKQGKKKLMITGFYTISQDKPDVVFDYCGCIYPEGVISSEKNLLFDHDDITEICFMGYESEEEKQFKENLKNAINQIEKSVVLNNNQNS